jgi:Mrp family chromosome partitioning ATPase
VRVLAEIPARSSPGLRPGTLRRGDLDAYAGLLERLGGARAVLVIGDAPGRHEGALALATAAAAAGTRTALLECELSQPTLADSLDLANAPGLHEYLLGEAEPERILKPVVLAGPGSADAGDALVCVVAGRLGGEAAVLLASERCRHALRGLRDSYELLVIDGPSSQVGSAPLVSVASEADAVIVWVEGATQPPELPVAVTGLVVQGR